VNAGDPKTILSSKEYIGVRPNPISGNIETALTIDGPTMTMINVYNGASCTRINGAWRHPYKN